MNKSHHNTLAMLAFTAALGFSGAAGAALIDRGNGLIYDDVLDITWLADANLFKTQYGGNNNIVNQIIAAVPTITDSNITRAITAADFNTTDGRMTWWGAMAWAEWLNFGGYSDWRLPATAQPDPTCQLQFNGVGSGPDCEGSELGYMFNINLGAAGSNNAALFTNIQPSPIPVYWSGAEAPDSTRVWSFFAAPTVRTQINVSKGDANYAWAVRSGDIAAQAVPEPASVALVGLGLAALGWVRRRG